MCNFALECKTTRLPRFPFSLILDHQTEALSGFRGTGAGFVIELRMFREAFYVPIRVRLDWPKKSMNRAALHEHAVPLPYNTRKIERKVFYDMAPLLSGVLPRAAQGGLFGDG